MQGPLQICGEAFTLLMESLSKQNYLAKAINSVFLPTVNAFLLFLFMKGYIPHSHRNTFLSYSKIGSSLIIFGKPHFEFSVI